MKTNPQQNLDNRLKLVVKSSLIILIGIFLEKILNYSYRIIVARQFGPEVYGIFSLALMILGWFISFSALGLNSGLVRYISLYRGKKETDKIKFIFKISSRILWATSIFAGLVLFLASDFISIHFFKNAELSIFLKLFSITLPMTLLANSYLCVLRAFEKMGWYSFIFNILQNVLKVASIIMLILLGFKSNAVIYSYIISALGIFIAGYWACRALLPKIFGKYSLGKKVKKETFKELFSYSWPLLFFGVIWSVFHWADSFMLGILTTVKDVGIYNAAVPLAFLLMLVPELFMLIFFPLVTKEYSAKNYVLVKELSKQVGKWIFALNLPILVLMLLFPGAFINFFFGAKYIAAESALRLLVIGTFIHSICMVSNNLISMTGKSKLILGDIIVALFINIALGLFLIPIYGITGAAFATMTSLIILDIIFVLQAKHYTSVMPFRRKMFGIFLASLIPTGILLVIKNFLEPITTIELILLGGFFGLLYLLLIFLFRCLDINDLQIINTLKKKIGIKF